MAERDESKKYKKKKQHTRHYYYYTPDEYASDEEHIPCEYYTPRLSREAGLMLYERASAAQKRLEGILKDETKQKIQCVKEMGRINGHLIAENQHVSQSDSYLNIQRGIVFIIQILHNKRTYNMALV